MLKICGKYIIKPRESALRKVVFPTSGRKQMSFMSIKNDKQLLKNYRPISLLPICGKVLERLLYNSMFEFFIQNNLITPNQSSYKTGNSCINQLTYFTYKIYKSFDDGYEVGEHFLIYQKNLTKYGTKVFTTN